MQTVLLPGATKPTSRIGLGCGRLGGDASVVEAALAVGIRHFDVAPSYGFGLAEGVLGQALDGSRDTTITTKAGIAAPRGGSLLNRVRQMVKPLVAHLPGVKARLAAAASAAAPTTHGLFSSDEVRASFDASLKALRRDRIDVFLLHEPPSEIPAGIEALLEGLRLEERIGTYGAGTGGQRHTLPPLGDIAQHLWTPRAATADGRLTIHHGLFRQWLPRLRSILPTEPNERRRLSESLGFDLDDAEALPALLLTMVLGAEPDSLMLISSNSPARVTRAVQGVDWSAVRGERPAFVAARDRLIASLAEAADV